MSGPPAKLGFPGLALDALEAIAAYLGFEDRLNLISACKDIWGRTLDSKALWHCVDAYLRTLEQFSNFTAWYSRRRAAVQQLGVYLFFTQPIPQEEAEAAVAARFLRTLAAAPLRSLIVRNMTFSTAQLQLPLLERLHISPPFAKESGVDYCPGFAHLPSLQQLEAYQLHSGNGLNNASLPSSLLHLKLYWLDGPGAPAAVLNAPALQSLRLQYDSNGDPAAVMTFLQQGAGWLAGVTRLALIEAGLTELPPEVAAMTALEELSLRGNRKLATVPPPVLSLPRLKRLSLRGCGLTSIPWQLWDLPHLKTLDLSSNPRLLLGLQPPEPPTAVAECPLRHLSISLRAALEPGYIQRLGGLASLHLDIHEAERLWEDVGAGLLLIETVKALPKLQLLGLLPGFMADFSVPFWLTLALVHIGQRPGLQVVETVPTGEDFWVQTEGHE